MTHISNLTVLLAARFSCIARSLKILMPRVQHHSFKERAMLAFCFAFF
jgi:hypothetical protein